MHQLRAMLPVSTNIKEAYKQGSNDEQNFIQNLSLFLCTFLKEHGLLIEKKSDLNELLMEVCNLNCSVLVTARKRSLGQGNIFTPVCHSVHSGGMRGYPGGHAWLPVGHAWLPLGWHAWLQGQCMVVWGCAWLQGGMHGCRGRAWVGGVRGCQGGVRRIRRDTVNERAVRILLNAFLFYN